MQVICGVLVVELSCPCGSVGRVVHVHVHVDEGADRFQPKTSVGTLTSTPRHHSTTLSVLLPPQLPWGGRQGQPAQFGRVARLPRGCVYTNFELRPSGRTGWAGRWDLDAVDALMYRVSSVVLTPTEPIHKTPDSAHSVIPPTGEGFNSGAEDVGVRVTTCMYACIYVHSQWERWVGRTVPDTPPTKPTQPKPNPNQSEQKPGADGRDAQAPRGAVRSLHPRAAPGPSRPARAGGGGQPPVWAARYVFVVCVDVVRPSGGVSGWVDR